MLVLMVLLVLLVLMVMMVMAQHHCIHQRTAMSSRVPICTNLVEYQASSLLALS